MQDIWSGVVSAMIAWHQGKVFIEHTTMISHDSLHVLLGVLLWLVLGLLTGRPLSSQLPWLSLFAIILWNETVDLWIERWPDPGMQYGEGVKDLLITMLVPTVLMFAIRLRPDLFRVRSDPRRRGH